VVATGGRRLFVPSSREETRSVHSRMPDRVGMARNRGGWVVATSGTYHLDVVSGLGDRVGSRGYMRWTRTNDVTLLGRERLWILQNIPISGVWRNFVGMDGTPGWTIEDRKAIHCLGRVVVDSY